MNTELMILTKENIEEKKRGKELFEILYKSAPELFPDFYGNREPLKKVFDYELLDDILENWIDPFIFKKETPSINGYIGIEQSSYKIKQHNSIAMSFNKGKFSFNQLMKLFYEWCKFLSPDFACITKLTKHEIMNGKTANTIKPLNKKLTKYNFSIYTPTLNKYLPDIYWLTVFGPSYISFFGKEKLLATPAYSVIELNDNNILIQLSESVEDLNNVALIEKCRDEIKRHLGEDSFFSTKKGLEVEYKTPWNSV